MDRSLFRLALNSITMAAKLFLFLILASIVTAFLFSIWLDSSYNIREQIAITAMILGAGFYLICELLKIKKL